MEFDSPDGRHKVTLKNDGELRFGPPCYNLSLDGGELRKRSFLGSVDWSPDSRYLLVQELDFSRPASPDIRLLAIDLESWRECFVEPSQWLQAPFSFSGSVLSYMRTVGATQTQHQCNLSTLTQWKPLLTVSPLEVWAGGIVEHVALSPDGRLIAQSGYMVRESAGPSTYVEVGEHREPFIRVVTVEHGNLRWHECGHARGTQSLCFSPGLDGDLFSGGTNAQGEGEAKRWNTASMRTYTHLDRKWISQLVPLADGKRLLAACASDNILKLIDIGTGKILRKFRGHEIRPDNIVLAAAVSQNSAFAVSAAMDSILKTWDVETGRCIMSIDAQIGAIRAVAMTAQGVIAAGGAEGVVGLWDSVSGALLRRLEGHAGAVRSIVASRSGEKIASIGVDAVLNVWEVNSGKRLVSFNIETAPLAIAFCSGDDELLVGTGTTVERVRSVDDRNVLWRLP